MARVKNQVLFEDEESYTDAGGSVHYNGVAYRQGATEAYPGYLGAEYGTVRKSPRSRRPPATRPRLAAAGSVARLLFSVCRSLERPPRCLRRRSRLRSHFEQRKCFDREG